MPIPRSYAYTVYTAIQYSGHTVVTNSQSIMPYTADSNGDYLLVTGTATVTDGGTGFAKGCTFLLTNATAGSPCVYFNKGSNTSCQFTLVTQA